MRLRHAMLFAMLMLAIVPTAADPLAGKWTLNLERSHYGGGAEARKAETFSCQLDRTLMTCTIESVRTDGRKLVGSFAAPYDGKPYPAGGIQGVDQVTLWKVDEFIADAAFGLNGKPVFGYRAVKSRDGKSLTIVSVDPTTRIVGSSVIVYDREDGPSD